MSYDNGIVEEKIIYVDPAVDAAARQQTLDMYAATVVDLKAQEKEAREHLQEVLTELDKRRAELKEAYAQKIQSLGHEYAHLQDSIKLSEQVLTDLEVMIEKRTAEYDQISLDFSERERELERDRADLVTWAGQLSTERRSLERLQTLFEQQRVEYEGYKTETQLKIVAKIDELNTKATAIESQVYDLNQLRVLTDNRCIMQRQELASLEDVRAEVKAAVSEAQPMLALAAQVKQDIARIEERTKELKEWQARLDADIAQVKTTQIVQKEKEHELISREKIIQAAEKKIGGSYVGT